MRKIITLFIALAVFVLQAGGVYAQQGTYGVPAPTLLGINTDHMVAQPLITGVTFNNTTVDVYIDGVFNGHAQVKDDPSGVASFAYVPFLPLTPGDHTVYTVARSLDQTVRSQESVPMTISVAAVASAHITLDSKVDETGKTQITGTLSNGYGVVILIEGKEFVRFTPPQATSGTITSFWYRPGLADGEYSVTVTAVDSQGNLGASATRAMTFVQAGEPTEDTSQSDTQNTEENPVTTEDHSDENTSDQPAMTTDSTDVVDPQEVLNELENQEGGVAIIDQTEDGNVVVSDTSEEGSVTIDTEGESGNIVTDTEAGDDVKVFGQDTSDEVGDIAGGASEDGGNAEPSNANRIAGFVILLIIAIILALWYVREKELEKKHKDDDTDDEIEVVAMNDSSSHNDKNSGIVDNNQYNSNKKKKKKRRR